MNKKISVLKFMDEMCGAWFKRQYFLGGQKRILLRNSWTPWKTLLSAMFALKPQGGMLARYTKHTGRTVWPTEEFSELFVIAGRGAGKSLISALIATYLSVFREYPGLVPGEVGIGMVLAVSKEQATNVMRYIKSFFALIPQLRALVLAETADSVTLKNGENVIKLQVFTNDYATVRGSSAIFCIADELAWWATDTSSANPDSEVIAAVKPALARVPGSKLIAISSPYTFKGVLYDAYRQHYGRNASPTLIWKAATLEMNATADKAAIDRMMAEDPERGLAEFFAEFRSGLEELFSREKVEKCIVPGMRERGPGAVLQSQYSTPAYVAFCDSSLMVHDSFTMAIAHREGQRVVLDVIREFPPATKLNPADVVEQLIPVLDQYQIYEITGDRFSYTWVQDAFSKHGKSFRLSEVNRSGLYQYLLGWVNTATVDLLDNEKLVDQLVSLRRRQESEGKEVVDHPPSSHDDIANSVAGAVWLCRQEAWTNAVREYAIAEAQGKYNQKLPATKQFEDAYNRAVLREHGVENYTVPTAASWGATKMVRDASKGFLPREKIPPCPKCARTETVQKLPHGELKCQQCEPAVQWWPEGKRPVVNYGGNRNSLRGQFGGEYQGGGESIVEMVQRNLRGGR